MNARARRQRRKAPAEALAGKNSRLGILLPPFVAALLCVPCLSLGYFWDDYLFLTQRGGSEPGGFLLPNPQAAFYRPIAQSIYFKLLRLVDPSSGALGHIINLSVLVAAISVLTLLIWQLSGPRSGIFAGLTVSCLGATPSLVAWISCSQDLFAIAFVLTAFLLRHNKKDIAALSCATVGVLCKEPAVAAFPILAFWDHIVGRPANGTWRRPLPYVIVLFLWVFIHPGVRILLSRAFQSGATGYVGLDRPDHWGVFFGRYVTTLLNLSPSGFSKAAMDDRIPYGLAALIVMVVGLQYLAKRQMLDHTRAQIPFQRIAFIAVLFGLPTLLMPTLLIRHWAPYFVCIPGVAFAMLVGPVLARQRTIVGMAALSVFLLLGLRYRAAHPVEEAAWTESVFVQAADAVKQVRANFRVLFPTLPHGSQLVVSTLSTGARGIHGTLVDNQALAVWYRDPSLRAVSTLKRRPTAGPEFLVRITSDMDVLAIDPDSHGVRSATPQAPDFSEIDRPLRNYARAVAAGGDPARAIRVLDGLQRVGPPESRTYSQRVMVAILLAEGRRAEADQIIASSQGVTRETALAQVERLLAEPTQSEHLDEASFEAFGLSGKDPATVRWMVHSLRAEGLIAQAAWYAERLQRLAPADAEAEAILLEAARLGIRPDRAPA